MTCGGWISMTTSLAIVIGLFGWCMCKLVATSNVPDDEPIEVPEDAPNDEVAVEQEKKDANS